MTVISRIHSNSHRLVAASGARRRWRQPATAVGGHRNNLQSNLTGWIITDLQFESSGWERVRRGGAAPRAVHPQGQRRNPRGLNGLHIVPLKRIVPLLKDLRSPRILEARRRLPSFLTISDPASGASSGFLFLPTPLPPPATP